MISIENISVRFESFALEDISLELEKSDYLALLGMSGAGKTVLLEVLAGLVKPQTGRIYLEKRDVTDDKIQNRGMGLVYQDLSLFPHMSVFENIAYPLKSKNLGRQGVRERVSELAGETGVLHLLDRSPGTLSGGEAQRVALARTLASDPKILLLDEPLSNLDVKLKAGLRSLLRRIHKSGKTVIHVTHDFMEAATLATKVAIVENGRLIQCGTPDEVFRHPATEFVARFSGIKNLFPCQVLQAKPGTGVREAIVAKKNRISFLGDHHPQDGFLLIPQEDIFVSRQPIDTSAINLFSGLISEAYLAGSGMELVVDTGIEFVVSISRQSYDKLQLKPGEHIWVAFKASAVKFLAG